MKKNSVKERKSPQKHLIMEHCTRVNGLWALKLGKEEVCKFGRTAPYMKDTGKTVKQMAMVVSFMRMATFTLATGKMTKPMVSVFTPTKTVPDTKVNGKKISNTEKVLRPGLIRLPIRVIMSRVKSMDLESLLGQTAVLTKAHSRTIT